MCHLSFPYGFHGGLLLLWETIHMPGGSMGVELLLKSSSRWKYSDSCGCNHDVHIIFNVGLACYRMWLLNIRVNLGSTLHITSTKCFWTYWCCVCIYLVDFLGGKSENVFFVKKHSRRGPAQYVNFFYTGYHLSELQSCTLIFSTHFYFIFIFK